MRTDRRFCSQQCRLWWYRHPGQKRPDFSPKYWGQPEPRGKGQPKTFAAALHALAEAREYAAQLEAAAKAQQLEDRKLRAKLSVLNDDAAISKRKHATERDGLRDELENAVRQIVLAERQAQDAREQAERFQAQNEELTAKLQGAKDEATKNEAAFEQASSEFAELRRIHAQRGEQHAEEVSTLKAQATTLTVLHNDIASQKVELTRDRDVLRGRVETAERSLTQRDEDLSLQRRHLAASERAHQEVHVVAESESRSLRAEKERRIAAEKRVEQLTRDLETLARESQTATPSDTMALLFGKHEDILTAELQEVRTHRDEVIAERELLAARILKLMAPGQYLEHAAAAGYDLTKDPLIRLKREEVVVESRLAAWQESNKKRRRARRRDPEQTLDEQAYAAALSFRWKQIDHPHLRRKRHPKWIAVGFLLDKESEEYLLRLTQERIDEMKKRMTSTGELH